jgi:hypothetical protein
MPNQSILPIRVVNFDGIQGFFDELQAREHIRLVKVADQGLVEPAKRGNALVMQPMARVVATAFDYKMNEILRWDDKWDVGSGAVPIDVSSGRGRNNDPTGTRIRDKIILECQKRSLQVVRDEEWTPEDFVDTLASIDGNRL